MSYAIAAAGTGGHVYPGLAVGEALVDSGVDREDVLYVGGNRLEAVVYPKAGFPFLEVTVRGFKRSLSPSNLALPAVMGKAVGRIRSEFRRRDVQVVLGMGGYITPPAVLAGRLSGALVMVSEQNAEAGLGNRFASRLAVRRFGSFRHTRGLRSAEWVGNPLRSMFSSFDRQALRVEAFSHFGLESEMPVLGVFGGSLGAGMINRAVARIAETWEGDPVQILHLCGESHLEELSRRQPYSRVAWHLVGFEPRMDLFYAASDLVVSRSGGSVAELLATGTPGILIPGTFGSGRHQLANAEALEEGGAATVIREANVDGLGAAVGTLISDASSRQAMAMAASAMSRRQAAEVIAGAMRDAHG